MSHAKGAFSNFWSTFTAPTNITTVLNATTEHIDDNEEYQGRSDECENVIGANNGRQSIKSVETENERKKLTSDEAEVDEINCGDFVGN